MLPGLGHGTIGGGDHKDCSVHLGCTGDHVLHVVGMPGAVDVGVVAFLRLVLHVGNGDGDSPLPLFGGFVNLFKGGVLGKAVLGEDQGDGSGEGGLPVVHVSNGTDVNMGLFPFELLLGHRVSSL